MLLKYDPEAEPIRNEHKGFVFQASAKFDIATISKKNYRARYVRQHQRQQPLMHANQHWRNLSPTAQANWITFAETFPEPTKANPDKFLTGYQLFCKRQHYVFLNGGIAEPWMLAPIAPELDEVTVSGAIKQEQHCLDVTELYIINFGLLPKLGDYLFIKIIPYESQGGKFYHIYEQTVRVDEVYIDGLFVSLSFPALTKGVTFAVYLSFPVSKNRLYQSSKPNYMGCFTVKSFLDLSDTPDSYEGQAGKKVVVKADESGLEFKPDAGGGLTCETLVYCPTIISLNANITNILNLINSGQLDVTFPVAHYGALYNYFAVIDARGLMPTGWHIATNANWNSLKSYLGGESVAGGLMKEIGLTYWEAPNTGATNASRFNGRGSGLRNGLTGAFSSFKQLCYMWMSDFPTADNANVYQLRSDAQTLVGSLSVLKKTGCTIRGVKDTTTLTNGQTGTMLAPSGNIYRTICIGNLEWIADNYKETKFRTGEDIPVVTDNAAWAALSTAAICAPMNNWSLV